MKNRQGKAVALTVMIASCLFSIPACAEPYLFELLDRPNFRRSWAALFQHEKTVDKWLASYSRTRDGVASRSKVIQIGGSAFLLARICKSHDCADNMYFVLFDAQGRSACGLLVKDGSKEQIFGHPDEARKSALRAAAQSTR